MIVDQLKRFLAAIDGGIEIQVGFEDVVLDVISVEYDTDSDALTLYVAEPIEEEVDDSGVVFPNEGEPDTVKTD